MQCKTPPDMTNSPLCLDTNFLVGLFDESDVWHHMARDIYLLLQEHQVVVVYLDCVMNELFTVLARRCRQRGRTELFPLLIEQISQIIPDTAITWVYPHLPRWYNRCLDVMEETQGQLNFHDALIVTAIKEMDFSALIGFDAGFDQLPEVSRLDSADMLLAWLS